MDRLWVFCDSYNYLVQRKANWSPYAWNGERESSVSAGGGKVVVENECLTTIIWCVFNAWIKKLIAKIGHVEANEWSVYFSLPVAVQTLKKSNAT